MAKLYEATLAGTYFGQETISRWNYVMTGTPTGVTGAFALAFAMGAIYDVDTYPTGTVLSKLSVPTSDAWDWQQLTVINPYDDTDFFQAPFVVPFGGVVTGEANSPIVAFGFRTNVVRRDIRRGTKRFPGVPEASVGTGGNIVSGALTDLDVLAGVMTDTLNYNEDGNSLDFAPAVVKKQKYQTNEGSPDPATYAYRYIPTDDGGESAQLADTATGITWSPKTTVRSQTSRQYGHGR